MPISICGDSGGADCLAIRAVPFFEARSIKYSQLCCHQAMNVSCEATNMYYEQQSEPEALQARSGLWPIAWHTLAYDRSS